MAVLFSATRLLPKLNILNNGGTEGGDPKTKENHHNLFYKTSSSIIKNKNSEKIAVSTTLCFSSKAEISTRKRPPTNQRKPPKKAFQNQFLSEGRENDDTHFLICPGCGVFMQNTNPNLPGFFQKRSPLQVQEDDAEEEEDQISLEGEELEQPDDELQCKFQETQEEEENEDNWWESEDFEIDFDDEEEELKKELEGFAPAGIGYGNVTEESMKKAKKERISKAEKKKRAREEAWKHKEEEEELTVCARCHSLRNYGQIKNQKVENLIPDFDFDRLISTRLMKPTSNSDASVVVMVVDCVDFDGSFPKRAAKSLFRVLEGSKKNDPKLKLPKLVLVATKVDLLPSQISPARLDKWVRHRAKANGAPKMNGVYLVSAHKDLGVRNLLSFIRELAGPRGNVWVIGAQNAGKSTLINMFAKKEGRKISKLTEAAVPGTTLGILRIGGILPAKAKMYDTPGLLHPYLMSMRLNRDEQKMVEIRKELRPRTYRIKAGQAIHVGALMRLDLSHASVQTIYVTIWASPNISLHLGKIENADEIRDKHAGIRLQPPNGIERVPELGKWEQKELKVSGNSWEVNSIDIAVAGLGWFSVGLKGEASLTLWTYEGVDVTLREPLVLDRAPSLERPGFLLPKAISDAIGNQSRLEAEKTRKVQAERNSQAEVIA